MTLDETLLQKLAKWRFHSGRQTLEAVAGDARLAVTADCADQVGCRLWEVALTRPTPPTSLRQRSERLAIRATGLLEPLRPIEVEGERQALLRSNQPAAREGQLAYYEVLLGGDGSARVRRFQAPRDGSEKRQQINFGLTHEALAKLAADLLDG